MAAYAGIVSAKHATLVAATLDTVTFTTDLGAVEVVNRSAADALSFTVNGATPTALGDNVYVVPPGVGMSKIVQPPTGDATVVRIISAGAAPYTVQAA
jgi:hypothetical protein